MFNNAAAQTDVSPIVDYDSEAFDAAQRLVSRSVLLGHKHAVVGIVRQAAAELGRLGIRSNAIAAGIVITPIMASAFGVPAEQADEFSTFLHERLGQYNPSGRVAQPGAPGSCMRSRLGEACARPGRSVRPVGEESPPQPPVCSGATASKAHMTPYRSKTWP